MPTFAELAAGNRGLVALERIVQMVAEYLPADQDQWCANVFWSLSVKPLLTPLVGWERGRAPCNVPDPAAVVPGPVQWNGRAALAALEEDLRWTRPADTTAEEVLRSSAAWDVAVEHLYELLPDCRNCGCLRGGWAA